MFFEKREVIEKWENLLDSIWDERLVAKGKVPTFSEILETLNMRMIEQIGMCIEKSEDLEVLFNFPDSEIVPENDYVMLIRKSGRFYVSFNTGNDREVEGAIINVSEEFYYATYDEFFS